MIAILRALIQLVLILPEMMGAILYVQRWIKESHEQKKRKAIDDWKSAKSKEDAEAALVRLRQLLK